MLSSGASCRLSLCAGGCERASQALDWAWDDDEDESDQPAAHSVDASLSGVCYYACANVVLCYCPALYRVTGSLRGHNAPVRCVRAISTGCVLSGALDGTVREWSVEAASGRYECVSTLHVASSGVSALDTCCVLNWSSVTAPPLRVLAAASDDGLHVWLSASVGRWRLAQLIPLPPQRRAMCVSLCVLYVSSGAILHLSVGGVDGRVVLSLCHLSTSALCDAVAFAVSPSASASSSPCLTPSSPPVCPLSFELAVSLSGHSDWVRSLSATVISEPALKQPAQRQLENGASVLLASAAQDKSIRLWRVQWRDGSDTVEAAAESAATRGLSESSLGSRGHIVHLCGLRGEVLFESLLSGHDDWVLAVQLTRSRPMRHRLPSAPVALDVTGADVSRCSELSWFVSHQCDVSVPASLVRLLTCSADNSAIVWSPAVDSSVWQISARLGELSSGGMHGLYGARWGSRHQAVMAHGSVQSHTTPRPTCVCSTHLRLCESEAVVSFSGSLHLWTAQPASTLSTSLVFSPAVCVSGHSQPVVDCCWDVRGRYLLSVGKDQTSRVFAPVDSLRPLHPPPGSSSSSPLSHLSSPSVSVGVPWCEIARPQVHGFDLNTACLLGGPIEHRMCSGADEKVIRVFLATNSFIQTLHNVSESYSVSSSSLSVPSSASSASPLPSLTVARAVRAVLPELGLSNRGLQAGDAMQQLRGFTPQVDSVRQVAEAAPQLDEDDDGNDTAVKAVWPALTNGHTGASAADSLLASSSSTRVTLSSSSSSSVFVLPPTDSQLSMLTLWPEVDKLYGHGSEIRRLCASPDGQLLASSCVAKTATQADVLLYDTDTWTAVGRVRGHHNTVSCIAFSHDSRLLLTGSKDRHLTLTSITRPHSQPLSLDTVRLAAHSRIVWDCAWSPDDVAFATCSRDKTVKLWTVEQRPLSASPHTACMPHFANAVTAVAFAPSYQSTATTRRYTMAVGSEAGDLSFWHIDCTQQHNDEQWSLSAAVCVLCVDARLLPSATILRLSFRPSASTAHTARRAESTEQATIAASSADHTLRLYEYTL